MWIAGELEPRRWSRALGAVVLVALGACGTVDEEALEAAASACPEGPPLQLGEGPDRLVLLNAYYLQDEAAVELRAGRAESAVVEETYAKVSALGARVLRTNGFNDDPSKVSVIQRAPRDYDEVALRALDLVLTRAAAYGLVLVLPLGNYWNDYGGARQYVEWARLPDPREGDPRFFTERQVVEHYKDHVGRLLNRVNTLDGIRYGEHPAVLAWELLNEPRNEGLDPEGRALRTWVDEVAAHVKALAPGHLVGTGEEGFDLGFEGYSEPFWRNLAPSLFVGGSFRLNLGSPWIDYASVHLYPEAWGITDSRAAQAGARWIHEHAALAREAGKPLVVGEFGLRNEGALTLPERRAMYRGWFRCAWRTGVAAMGPWMFSYDARPDGWDLHTFYFRDGTSPEDPVNRYADIVIDAARR